MPIRSDVDLLVLTDGPLSAERVRELCDATYPLFLECGRQIKFRTAAQLARSADDRAATFRANFEREAVLLWRRGADETA